MYVCVCNAVTERTIRTLVADGYDTLNEIQALTGCAGSCGTCRDYAEAVIAHAVAQPEFPRRLPLFESAAQPA